MYRETGVRDVKRKRNKTAEEKRAALFLVRLNTVRNPKWKVRSTDFRSIKILDNDNHQQYIK